nr:MAG TPA: hypothetical protein [Caudoviricetes sp.]
MWLRLYLRINQYPIPRFQLPSFPAKDKSPLGCTLLTLLIWYYSNIRVGR